MFWLNGDLESKSNLYKIFTREKNWPNYNKNCLLILLISELKKWTKSKFIKKKNIVPPPPQGNQGYIRQKKRRIITLCRHSDLPIPLFKISDPSKHSPASSFFHSYLWSSHPFPVFARISRQFRASKCCFSTLCQRTKFNLYSKKLFPNLTWLRTEILFSTHLN